MGSYWKNLHLSDPGSIHLHQWGMIVTWTVLADSLILLARYKKTQNHYHNIHSFLFILVGALTYFLDLVKPRNFENLIKDPKNLLFANKLMYLHKLIGGYIYLLCIGITIGGLALRQAISTERFNFLDLFNNVFSISHMRRAHGLFGVLIWLLARFVLVTGVLHDNLIYGPYAMIFVFAETFFFMLAVASLETKLQIGYVKYKAVIINWKNQESISGFSVSLDSNLITDMEIDLKLGLFVYFKNYIVDLKKFIHPGGQWMLKHLEGREVSRYIYGVSPLERSNTQVWAHSNEAASYLGKLMVGTLFNPINENEWILRDRKYNVASYSTNQFWRISKKTQVHGMMYLIDFESTQYEINCVPNGILYFAKHYILTNEKKVRIYTSCIALNDEIENYRSQLIKFLVEQDKTLIPEIPKDTSSTLRFLIKCLENRGSLSNEIKNAEISEEFRIEGPFGPGLGISASMRGEVALIFSGTGIAAFIELLDFLLRKAIYHKLHEQGGDTSVVHPAQNYDEYLSEVRFKAFAAFQSSSEFVAKDWISTLLDLSKSRPFGLHSLTVRIPSTALPSPYTNTSRRFDASFWEIQKASRFSKIFICGGQPFVNSVHSSLLNIGVEESKIVIV